MYQITFHLFITFYFLSLKVYEVQYTCDMFPIRKFISLDF